MDTDHTDVDGLTTDENIVHSDVLHGSQTTVVDDNTNPRDRDLLRHEQGIYRI